MTISSSNNQNKRKTRSDKFNFTKSDIKKIEKMAAFGLSIQQISAIFDISTDTFYRRAKESNIDLSAALVRGKAKATYKIASKAFELASQGNIAMIKYYLSTVSGWETSNQANHLQDSKANEINYGLLLERFDAFPSDLLEKAAKELNESEA